MHAQRRPAQRRRRKHLQHAYACTVLLLAFCLLHCRCCTASAAVSFCPFFFVSSLLLLRSLSPLRLVSSVFVSSLALYIAGVVSSVVELSTADRRVIGSNPILRCLFDAIYAFTHLRIYAFTHLRIYALLHCCIVASFMHCCIYACS